MADKKPESTLWVFVEQRSGKPVDVSLELLGKARDLAVRPGWKVGALLLGHDMEQAAQQLSACGAQEILLADDPLLAEYRGENYVAVLERAIGEHHPEVLLMGATAMGSDLAPRLAARLRTGLSAHCVDLELDEQGVLAAVIPWSGGNYLGRIICPVRRPQMATVSPGVFDMPREASESGEILRINGAVSPDECSYQILERHLEDRKPGDMETAGVVVAGGYGIGKKEDWHLIEELASLLGGVTGATRPPVDEGWTEDNRMIGQSGRTVHPRLYIAVGISGHLHHVVGVKGAELKIAVNTDPRAAIFDHTDLGLVGDYREILPALMEALKNS